LGENFVESGDEDKRPFFLHYLYWLGPNHFHPFCYRHIRITVPKHQVKKALQFCDAHMNFLLPTLVFLGP
jgi:hypothetical protein